jgi:hypothetical protein
MARLRARLGKLSAARWFALGGATLTVLLITSPVYLTKRSFGPDWTNALWLSWHQGVAIRDHGLPSLYLLADSRGLFEPFFAFYGGPLYGAIGAVSAALGNRPEVAFTLANLAVVAGAYAGMAWLGREIGGSRLARHVGAVVFVSSPYYVTDLYARGAFAELVALSAIPLALAAGVVLLRRPWTAQSVAAFAFALVVISGSHNLTLVWGTTLLVIIGGAAWLFMPAGHRPPIIRIVALVALAAVSVGINSWAFLFNALYNSKVLIGAGPGGTSWDVTSAFNAPKAILDPFRQQVTGSGTPGLSVAAPVFALLWAAATLWRGSDRVKQSPLWVRRLALVIGGGIVLIFVGIIWPWPWSWMPDPLNRVQFPYRLNGYLAILIAVLVPLTARLVAGRAPDAPDAVIAADATESGAVPRIGEGRRWGDPRWIASGLAVLVALSLTPGLLQAWSKINLKHPWSAKPNRETVFANGPGQSPTPSFYDQGSYRDAAEPVVAVRAKRHIDFPLPGPGGTRVDVTVKLPKGTAPISTNIAGGPYAVDISGVKRIGRTPDGLAVVQPLSASSTPTRIVISAKSGVRTLGWILTLVCFLAVAGLTTLLALRGRGGRRSAGATAQRAGVTVDDEPTSAPVA